MSGARSIESKIDAMFGTSSDEGADDGRDPPTGSTEEFSTASDGSDNGGSNAPANTSTGDQQEAEAQPTTRQNRNASGDDDTSTSGAQQRRREQPNGRNDQQADKPPQRRLPANNNGDLIDPNTGRVLARAGTERRYYEMARHATGEVQRINHEMMRVTAERDALREAAVMPTQLGLSPQEAVNAMQWFAHWKRNPAEAAAKVLTEARAMGHNVEGLDSGLDMEAIKRLVNEAVSPFVQDRQQAQTQYEQQAQIAREVDSLYAQFDWARGQGDELASLMQADPTLTLREAALTLQSYALQNGYDLSKPLRPQVLAARDGNQQQQAPQQRNNARMPGPSAANGAPIVPRRPAVANHTVSTRDLVRDAMREAGFNVDRL